MANGEMPRSIICFRRKKKVMDRGETYNKLKKSNMQIEIYFTYPMF
jgi:hypothetical protein